MYIRLIDNGYPLSEQQVRQENPNVSGPMPYNGYAYVFPVPQPEHNYITQGVREISPVLIEGKYRQSWEIYDLPENVVQNNISANVQRISDEIIFNTQKRLDTFARTRNYDGILSACTYATSTVPKFQQEAQYCVEARDATWAKLYEIMADIQSGNRPMPSGYEDIEPELPVLQWPN